MSRGTTAVINFEHLQHNFQQLNQRSPGPLVLVVKADAYGHGLQQVVSALKDAECFGVATIEEAMLVRKTNANVRVLLLEGFLSPEELVLASQHRIDCVIHQQQQMDLMDAAELPTRINVWLKFDAGMNRLGFAEHEYQEAIDWASRNEQIDETVLMSHFACADDKSDPFTAQQTARFLQFVDGQSVSLSNTSALLNGFYLQKEWCRVGLALFGVSPIAGQQASDFGLKPVMTLKTNVIAIKKVNKGQGIGYSQKYKVQRDMVIAIIGMGYGDGYPWSLTDEAHVMLRGHRADIVGRVSMDMIAIDISVIEDVQLGEPVLVWGQDQHTQLTVESVAQSAKTIPYVLLCQITSRVHYHYVH